MRMKHEHNKLPTVGSLWHTRQKASQRPEMVRRVASVEIRSNPRTNEQDHYIELAPANGSVGAHRTHVFFSTSFKYRRNYWPAGDAAPAAPTRPVDHSDELAKIAQRLMEIASSSK